MRRRQREGRIAPGDLFRWIRGYILAWQAIFDGCDDMDYSPARGARTVDEPSHGLGGLGLRLAGLRLR